MANEAILIKGTKLNIAVTGVTALVADAGFAECADDDRQPGNDAGYPLGLFEFNAVGTFSVAPTAGAVINLYEQKINSSASDAPDVSATYKNDYIGTFIVDAADVAQALSLVAPIHRDGGKYWIEWVDGGAGVASIAAGWTLDLTPVTYGT